MYLWIKKLIRSKSKKDQIKTTETNKNFFFLKKGVKGVDVSTRVRILAYVSPYISSKGGKHRDITISISVRPLHFMGLRRLHEPNWNIERRLLLRAQLLASRPQ